MRASPQLAWGGAAYALFALALSAACATGLVMAAHLTVPWLVLALVAMTGAAIAAWSGNPKQVLMQGFLVTVTVDISKALIVPGGVYAPGLSLWVSDIFFCGYFVLWLGGKILRKERLRVVPLARYGFVFVLFMWASTLYSEDPLTGALTALMNTKFYLMFLVLSDDLRRPEQLRAVLVAFAAALALQVMMTAAQLASGSYLAIQGSKVTTLGTELAFGTGDTLTFRPSGFMQHPNVLADFLVFVLPPLTALTLLGARRLGRAWLVAAGLLLAGLAALLITLSRGGWIAYLAALLFVAYYAKRAGFITMNHIALAAGTATAGVILVALLYPAVFLRLTQSDQHSSESRWIMMDQALLIVSRNPVLGVGLGGYNRAAHNNIPASFSNVNEYYQKQLLKGVVHNKYLLVASEQGLVGLALFVLLAWKMLRVFQSVRRWTDRASYALGLGLAAGIAGQAVFWLFDHFYVDVRIQMLWLFAAFLVALVRLQPGAAR